MTATLVKLPKSPVAKKISPKQIKIARQRRYAAFALCGFAVVLTCLSLTDLSEGIKLVTKCAAWQSWALAIGIDCSFLGFEVAAMTCPTNAKVTRITFPAIIALLSMSAIFNALAFSHEAAGWEIIPAVGLGVAIPAIIFALTKVAGAILLIDTAKK